MKIEKLKLFEIKINPDNPRIIKDDKFKQLVKSIKDFPQMLDIRPIVINKDNMILGGNMRLRACQEAGLKEVSVIRAESLTEARQKEFIIKDNSNYGEWDFDKLANEWGDFPLVDWGCEIPEMNFGNFDKIDAKIDEIDSNNKIMAISIDFLPEDFELFLKIMGKVKIKYNTPVKSTSYGLKISKIFRTLKDENFID